MLIVCSLVLFILQLLRMRIKFEFCTKMVFCFSFIVNCAKPDSPIKGPKHVFNIGTYIKVCLDALFRRWTKSHLITSISFHKKALSTFNIYKIVIRLKSQVLSKEDSRLVADRHAISFFCSSSKPLEHWTDALTAWVTSLVQSHHHIFSLCWPIWIFLTCGRAEKFMFKPRHWRSLYRSLAKGYIFFWHTNRQTRRQTGRQTYIFSRAWAHRPHITVCRWTVSELYMYICVILHVNEPYQTLVSLHQSVLCAYDNVTFFWRGCLICLIVLVVKLLTDFEAFCPTVKDFALGVSVVILDGASVVQIL